MFYMLAMSYMIDILYMSYQDGMSYQDDMFIIYMYIILSLYTSMYNVSRETSIYSVL